MKIKHGVCLLLLAGAAAVVSSSHSAAESRKYTDAAVKTAADKVDALSEVVLGVLTEVQRTNASLDRILEKLDRRPEAKLDLHGQEQSMIVILPMPSGAVDVQALAREALVKIQERNNGTTVGNEQRDTLLHLGGPTSD